MHRHVLPLRDLSQVLQLRAPLPRVAQRGPQDRLRQDGAERRRVLPLQQLAAAHPCFDLLVQLLPAQAARRQHLACVPGCLQQARQHADREVPQADRLRLQRHVPPVPLAELRMVPRRQLPQGQQQTRRLVVGVERLDDLRAAERLALLHLPEQRPVPAQRVRRADAGSSRSCPQGAQLLGEPLTRLLAAAGDGASLRHTAAPLRDVLRSRVWKMWNHLRPGRKHNAVHGPAGHRRAHPRHTRATQRNSR